MRLTPRRLSVTILAVVVLFTLGVVTLLVVKGRPPREPADFAPTKADFRIKEIRLQEQGSGKTQWRLVADQAEVFEREGKTLMRKVTITIQEPDRTWTVTGDEGDLWEGTNDVELRRNVVLRASDGLRLETDRLRWHAKERRVWTRDPVTIRRQGAVVRGQGLDAWLSDERTRVQGPLRATFSKGKPFPAGLGGGQERRP